MCRAICRTCVESSPAGGPSSHPTPGRGAGVPCTPQANAARPAAAYLCYHAAEDRGVHRRRPTRAVRAASGRCRLTVFAAGARDGRGGGRRGRPSRDKAGQFRAAHGRSRPAGAAGQPGPGQCGGQESSRGGGLSPGRWARRAGGQGRGGLELPAARSLRISGPKDKKFRSRSGGGCREAGPGCRKRDRGGSGQQDQGGSGQQDRGDAGKQDRGDAGKQDRGDAGKQDRGDAGKQDRGDAGKQDRGQFRPAGRGGEFRHKRTGAGSGRQEARAGSADKNRPGELGRRARTG